MNKNRALVLALAIFVILACSLASGSPVAPASTPVPPTSGPDLAATQQAQDQLGTFVAQTVEVQQPAATETSVPATVAPPTLQATHTPFTPSQWNGTFRWFGSVNPVTFIIQKVNGTSFTGAMFWTFPQCRITERTEGDVIYDITTATEQNRWALHPDFQSGDKGGIWLRWTQNESIGATKCYLTISGDWWYAHINSSGHMVGIHFTNSTNTEPDRDATFDFTKQ